jgi:hypothetical protein
LVVESTAQIFEETYEKVPAPGPDTPRVLFRSSLVISREVEDALCDHAKKWYTRLDQELGREDTSMSGFDNMGAFFSNMRQNIRQRGERRFFEKRLLFQRIAENNMDHRAEMDPESIFGKSNLVVPLARTIASKMGARAIRYFFDTDPWFAQYPVGGDGDKKLAQQLQRLTEVKFQDSGSTDAMRRAVTQSFIINETVMKVTQVHDQELYRETIVCAVDGAGNPLEAADGEPILPTDTFSMIEDPAKPGSGQMLMILDRDKQTPVEDPAALNFQEVTVDRQVTHYSGPRAAQIHWRDFLCPLNAPTVQEAECVIHVIERTASQIVQTYVQATGGKERLEEIQRAVEAVRDGLQGSNFSKSGERAGRAELGETVDPESSEAVSEYGEFYIRYDADGDMIAEDIMLVMNLRTGFPIYYDYVANVTADKRRPFIVIRPKAVINRWYGSGAIEQFELHQETVDLMVNRRNFNQSGSGRVIQWRPHLTLEGEANPNLEFNWGMTLTPKPGVDMEDVLKVTYIEDNKSQNLTQELEFFLQLAMNESGVQHANDGNTAGADSTKLATGIRNIEKSGQELFGVVLAELDGGASWGITGVTQAFTTTLYANLDDEETFDFFEGEFVIPATVAAADVKKLRMNVRTLLTRYKEEQVLASSTQATVLVEKFYSMVGPLQELLAGMFRDQLRALQVARADDYIVPQLGPLIAPQPTPAVGGVGKPSKQADSLL